MCYGATQMGGHSRGSTATVVVRPESLRVGSGELRATVKGSTFLGSFVALMLAEGGRVASVGMSARLRGAAKSDSR